MSAGYGDRADHFIAQFTGDLWEVALLERPQILRNIDPLEQPRMVAKVRHVP
jgi:hypothetical protein